MNADNLLNMPVIKAHLSLMVDALYLNGAEKALELGLRGISAVDRAMKKVERLDQRREAILETHEGKSFAAYDDLEPISIQLEAAEHDLGVAHAPVLQAMALVHILTAASLEAHINGRGIERLSGKRFESFEEFSLEAKWIKFPKLLGFPGFDVGAEPFQSFSRLVKLRNSLLHYKAKREDWIPPVVPTFLLGLGLTREEGEKSIKAAKRMIRELSRQLGESEPFWLRRRDNISYFDVNFE
jgi:hypothetical protein